MKNTTLIFGIIVALAVGSGIGYVSGKGVGDNGAKDKELRDSIAMMKEQAVSIQKMGELMKSSGITLQEFGANYKDDSIMSMGKDLEAMGGKYVKENAKATESNDSMKNMMGQ